MSKPRLLLAASLICNAILVAWAALPGASSGDAPAWAAKAPEPGTSHLASWFATLAPSSDSASPAKPAQVPDAEYSEAGWTRSLYDDVAELRERGFDDATVRMLALAEAERLFRERAQAVFAPRQRPEYWEARRKASRIDPAQLATYQRLRREKLAAIAELVGPDAVSTERNTPYTFTAAPLMTLDYLPTGKRLALTEYLETSEFELRATYSPLGRLRRGGTLPGPGNHHLAHEVARDEQIRLILGPESYEEYVRRSSDTARRVRSQLAPFKPTRAEFDALVTIEHEHRATMAQVGAFRIGVAPTRIRTMMDQQTDAIRAALGEQRYTDYERARDHSVVTLDRVLNELQVSPETARTSFEQLEQARTKWQALMAQASRANSPDPRVEENLVAVQRQLRSDLAATLGLEELSEDELSVLFAGMELFEPFRRR